MPDYKISQIIAASIAGSYLSNPTRNDKKAFSFITANDTKLDHSSTDKIAALLEYVEQKYGVHIRITGGGAGCTKFDFELEGSVEAASEFIKNLVNNPIFLQKAGEAKIKIVFSPDGPTIRTLTEQKIVNQSADETDVLLICALKDEYDEVLRVNDGLMPTGWIESHGPDGWIVADGKFKTSTGNTLSIRATWSSHMGREQVQAVASSMIQKHSARCIAMAGICAGRRDDISLGDVIFAERLWSYDAGKIVVEDGEHRFRGDMMQYRPPSSWTQRMQALSPPEGSSWLASRPELPFEYQEDWVLLRLLGGENPVERSDFKTSCPDWSDVLKRLWKRKWVQKLVLTPEGRSRAEELSLLYPEGLPPPKSFRIRVAPMATGATVTEDAGIFPRLSMSMRKVLGIDMEASALAALGEIQGVPVIIAKGVSDFGDPFKDDRYRHFSARASAECLIALLRNSMDLLQLNNLRKSGAGNPLPT